MLILSFTASSVCVECLPAFSVHLGLEKRRREREKKKDDQIPCTSRKGNFSNVIKHFIRHLRQ
jgi:hypothetical protein